MSVKESHKASSSELTAHGSENGSGITSIPVPISFQFHSTAPAPAPPILKVKQACSGLQPHLHVCACSLSAPLFFSLKKGVSCSTCGRPLGPDTSFWHSQGSVKLLSKWICQAVVVYKQIRNNFALTFFTFYFFIWGEDRVHVTTTCMEVGGQFVRVIFLHP